MASKKTGWNGPPFKKLSSPGADLSESGLMGGAATATEETSPENPEKTSSPFDCLSPHPTATDDEFSDGQEERGNIFKRHFNALMKQGQGGALSDPDSEDDNYDSLLQPGKKARKRVKRASGVEKENVSPETNKSEKTARGLCGINTCEWFVVLKRVLEVMKTQTIDYETVSFSNEVLLPLLKEGKIVKRGWENVPNKSYHVKKKLKGLLVEFLKKKAIQRDFLVQFEKQQDHQLLKLLFQDILRLDRENKDKPRMKRLPLKGVTGAGEHYEGDISVPTNKESVEGRKNRELVTKILAENAKTLGPVDASEDDDNNGGPGDEVDDGEGDTGAGAGDTGAGNKLTKHFDIAMGASLPQRRNAPSTSKSSNDVNSILRKSEENMDRTEGLFKELEKSKEERHKQYLEDSRMRTLALAKLVETKSPTKFINIFHEGKPFAYSLKLGDLKQIVSETLGYLKEPETVVDAVLYHYNGNRPILVSDPIVLSREQDDEVKVSLVTRDPDATYLQFCYNCNCDITKGP